MDTVISIMSSALYLILACAIIGAFFTILHDWKTERQRKKETEELIKLAEKSGMAQQVLEGKDIGTRDVFKKTLSDIGCQYQIGDGEDKLIFFDFQGEHFYAATNNDNLYVVIWDMFWETVDLNDIDEVSRYRRAINSSNSDTMVTTLYSIDEENLRMDIHCRAVIPFAASMPRLDEYLKMALGDFFKAHRLVNGEVLRLREKEHA